MPFGSLWMPVIVSAVAVFVASSLVHMVLKYHRADIKQIPNEDAVRDVLGKASLPPGLYMIPYCSDGKAMKEPAMVEKLTKGPIAIITVMRNGAPNMGKHLGQWLGFCVLVSFTAAYVARLTLHPGDGGMLVVRLTGTVAFTAYGFSNIIDSIWKAQPWSNTVRALVDGVIYSVVTGGTFCLLWPKA